MGRSVVGTAVVASLSLVAGFNVTIGHAVDGLIDASLIASRDSSVVADSVVPSILSCLTASVDDKSTVSAYVQSGHQHKHMWREYGLGKGTGTGDGVVWIRLDGELRAGHQACRRRTRTWHCAATEIGMLCSRQTPTAKLR